MAERGDPELAQVALGQRWQQARVDVVVAERLLVLAQAQPAQPSADVHPVPRSGALAPVAAILSQAGPDRHGR